MRASETLRALVCIGGALALVAAAGCGGRPTGEDPSPIDASTTPEQSRLEDPTPVKVSASGWDFVLTPTARYVLRGVVVSRERYSSGWNGSLSPCDVAMVWGELAAGENWRKLEWSQGYRWYTWRWRGQAPFSKEVTASNSSNTHIVPATRNVGRAACSLSEGDLAELSGELIRIDGRKGDQRARWVSSLSREDTGDGSCELLYLRRLRVNGKVYE
jgi:hypothetical protein